MSLLRTPPEEAVVVQRDPVPRAKDRAKARAKDFAQLYASPCGMFFAAIAIFYACAIILATLTLNPYFAQTWDVSTFIQAARRFLDGGNPFDLYAQSRAAQTWPYAYPPLHALTVAVALLIGNGLPLLPDYVWARVPAMLADVAVAVVLYRIVERRSHDRTLARSAALVWLFNPVTFYNTAVQGHFESEWLLFVLLAYAWYEEGRSILWSTLALALAVLFKQVAILFAIPLWVMLLRPTAERNATASVPYSGGLRSAALSIALFALVVGVVCLPFLLYSDDFLYMNLTYVENVPVQTQSWLVGVLGFTRAAPDALSSDFFLLRYQAVITLIATLAIAAFAVFGVPREVHSERRWSLYAIGVLIALAFFLTSKKVMGYYYVMLFPFLLAAQLPKRRYHIVTLALVATTWIALAPYYASWTNHAHWWIYAVLGALNSMFFVWMFVRMVRENAETLDGDLRTLMILAAGLFAAAVFAALLQPLISSTASPIRAPIIPPGSESSAWIALFGLWGLLAVAWLFLRRWIQKPVAAAWGIVMIFAPLFWGVYTLTKESTAIFEMALAILMALKSLGG